MTYAADDYAFIKAKQDEIRAEQVKAIAGEPAKADVPEPDQTYAQAFASGGTFTVHPGISAEDFMGYSMTDFVVDYAAWRNTRPPGINSSFWTDGD
jgi:hypothetical protein